MSIQTINIGTAADDGTGDPLRTAFDKINDNYAVTSNLGRNLIINGDFSIWQRGTSQTTDGYGSADRWQVVQSGATHTTNRQTHTLGQTDVPGCPTYFLRHDVTTGNDFTGVQHSIENVCSTAGREVTLSFYAKGTNPGGGACGVRTTQHFGTGGSPSAGAQTDLASFTLTSSWQRFTYTFTPASVTGKTLGTNGDDAFRILIGQGSDTSTAAWQLDISNVQLEFGNTASEFEYVSPADQLARCKRYYQKSYNTETAPGTATITGSLYLVTANTAMREMIPINHTMRTSPSMTIYSPNSGASGNIYGSTDGDVSASADNVGQNFARLFATATTAVQTVNYHYTADAEL